MSDTGAHQNCLSIDIFSKLRQAVWYLWVQYPLFASICRQTWHWVVGEFLSASGSCRYQGLSWVVCCIIHAISLDDSEPQVLDCTPELYIYICVYYDIYRSCMVNVKWYSYIYSYIHIHYRKCIYIYMYRLWYIYICIVGPNKAHINIIQYPCFWLFKWLMLTAIDSSTWHI